ncbi:L-alanine-DL-glutamate epimerase-like enolase superfamily enzyme [Catenulispora sp. EB89]
MLTAITSAEVLISSPGRNFVTLRLTTADGVTGLGDATVNGRELSVASYLSDHVVPLLISRDAHAIEDTWQYLYRGAYWRRGPITMAAIAAVDTALWDIKAKMAGMPLYQLLGGRSRRGCLAYGHASGADTEELFDSVRAHLDQGYRAIRIQTGIPGLSSVYGVASSSNSHVGEGGGATTRYDHEPARRSAVPVEEEWDTRAYLRHMPRVFEAVRSEFGPELPLLHDAHHRLTPIQAARLGKELEPYDLFWLEDVTPAENTGMLRRVREHTTTPLAIGEVFNTIWDYRELFEERNSSSTTCAPRSRTPEASRPCDASSTTRPSTRSSPGSTAPPTSPRSAWPPRCTSASRSPTSASRST